MNRRMVIDISTLAHWNGPAVGLIRVEREVALWCKANVPGTLLAFYDPVSRSYRRLLPDFELPVVKGDIGLDHWDLGVPMRAKDRVLDNVPGPLRTALIWILQLRRQSLLALERLRTAHVGKPLAELIEAVQRPMMSQKYHDLMTTKDGQRRPYLKASSLLGEQIDLGPGDILVEVGNAWLYTDIEAVKRLKRERGIGFVLMIHDIIPLLMPQFYNDDDVALFQRYVDAALPAADLVITTNRRAEQDILGYATSRGLTVSRTAVNGLGSDGARRSTGDDALARYGLKPDGYALMVSTIEPRKGHEMIHMVWRRLLAEGVPQKRGFKLVLVGREGWMVDDLMAALRETARETGSLLLLSDVSDEALAGLYEGAAFCLYPSRYEGYGLPIVEALQYGKPVIASNAGPMKELAADYTPAIDPEDAENWESLIRSWIEEPERYRTVAADIRMRYKPVTWAMSVASFVAKIEAAFAEGQGVPRTASR